MMLPTIYRDPTTATGLTLTPGPHAVEVSSTNQLPSHRVELHTFYSADIASVFVDGLNMAGGSNTMSWQRDAGSEVMYADQIVLVARFNEERPQTDTLAEAVPVVHHRPNGEDGARVARHNARTMERDVLERRKRAEGIAAVLETLAAAGIEACNGGWSSVGATVPSPGHSFPTVSVLLEGDGRWGVNVDTYDHNGYLFERDLDPRIVQALEAIGLSRAGQGGGNGDFCFEPVTLDGLVDVIQRIAPFWQGLQPVLLDIWHERTATAKALLAKTRKEAATARRKARNSIGLPRAVVREEEDQEPTPGPRGT